MNISPMTIIPAFITTALLFMLWAGFIDASKIKVAAILFWTFVCSSFILLLCIVSLIVGAFSLNFISKGDMSVIAHGEYMNRPDCFDIAHLYIGNTNIDIGSSIDQTMITAQSPHILIDRTKLKPGNVYSVYEQKYFLGHNFIIFCDE